MIRLPGTLRSGCSGHELAPGGASGSSSLHSCRERKIRIDAAQYATVDVGP